MRALKQELAGFLNRELGSSAGAVDEAQQGHGDLMSNVAMKYAKAMKQPPRKLAEDLLGKLRNNPRFEIVVRKAEVAGPGFINFYLAPEAHHEMLSQILSEQDRFGRCAMGEGRKVLFEFVSANPTGPLTVAHGRQAAVGDVLVRVLRETGHEVCAEYLINDAGRQIQTLGQSALARYREVLGEKAAIPEDGYKGDYVREIAEAARKEVGEKYKGRDDSEAVGYFSRYASAEILAGIREDLKDFDVAFDNWFSEKAFHKTGRVQKVMEQMRKAGHVYDRDGAVWFASTNFGDDKDRVLVKSTGELTYITPDIAYHQEKFSRGFDRLINIWGPDHHGYVPRLRSGVTALGHDKEALKVILLQLVTLSRDGKKLSMSTRAGEFVTLRELMEEVGKDAARYFFVRRKTDAHLDFDLELAKKHSADNPVFYVQYAHARIASIFRKGGSERPTQLPVETLRRLQAGEELALIRQLSHWEEVLEGSARTLEPHWIPNFLEACAAQFHKFYTECKVLSEDAGLTRARLALCRATQIVLRNGLRVLGVTAPESM